jgi:predicted metalloprotease with PDZ domain
MTHHRLSHLGASVVRARAVALAASVGCALISARPADAQSSERIAYTLRVPAPETHTLVVAARIPTGGQDSVILMMPTWSPGFYRVEDYAGKIQAISATGPDGKTLEVRRWPAPGNRWTVTTSGAPFVTVTYRLLADGHSVTTDWVGPELGVVTGPATFITVADAVRRPYAVTLVPPAEWPRAATGLAPAPGGSPDQWSAPDYDDLVDEPIVAGDLSLHAFDVRGHSFELVDVGQPASWDGARAAADLSRIVRAADLVWRDLPFQRYVFLNVFRRGGGGLEHKSSTLLTASDRAATPEGYRRWLEFVAHEYVHAFNVKRLRPVELGPFDYEREPHTPALWEAEGVTTYLADLALARAGLSAPEQFLLGLSEQIADLQSEPGRLVQTVAQSSLNVWTNSLSGINADSSTVSYYVKGTVLGFLLDARVRHASGGRRSLDDVMRVAYRRYGGARGFTPDQFRAVASEVAGTDLSVWFRRAVNSTEELDYGEALDWFGLRFADPTASGPARWSLAVRPDASEAQQAHLHALLTAR